ncbi:phage tail length tape-measure protein [Bacillus sp. JCM 19047]|nr:phage tail length tape-measure protein [Bacillus sp. JCM 19047]
MNELNKVIQSMNSEIVDFTNKITSIDGSITSFTESISDIGKGFQQTSATLQKSGGEVTSSVGELFTAANQLGGGIWGDSSPLDDIEQKVSSVAYALDQASKLSIPFSDKLSTSFSEVTAEASRMVTSVLQSTTTTITLINQLVVSFTALKAAAINVTATLMKIKPLAAVFGFLISPIGIVVGLIAALAVGFLYLQNANGSLGSSLQAVWEKISSIGSEVFQ